MTGKAVRVASVNKADSSNVAIKGDYKYCLEVTGT